MTTISAFPKVNSDEAYTNNSYHLGRLVCIFSLLAVVLGAVEAWAGRCLMNVDGVSYLDLGDAIWHTGWRAAITACWSPLYPFLLGLAMNLLKPSVYWEFPTVHLVNFIIYLFSLICFYFFIFELLHYHSSIKTEIVDGEDAALPEWILFFLASALFLWSALNLISLRAVTPDMLASALTYLAFGIITRLKRKEGRWLHFVFLGIVLGFGYLAKTYMFFVAILFLGISCFLLNNLKKAIQFISIALVTFFFISGPFIVMLSRAKGYLTIGEIYKPPCGGFHCHTGDPILHWQGEACPGPDCCGRPIHPTRKLFDKPKIFEFGSPIKATYAPWYDPSYWYAGLKPFDTRQKLRSLGKNLVTYFCIFFRTQGGWLFSAALILFFFMSRRHLLLKEMSRYWFILLPVILVLTAYLLIAVRSRYVAAFIVLFWMCFFCALRVPNSNESGRLVKAVVYATVLFAIISIVPPSFYNLISQDHVTLCIESKVADGLKLIGVKPQDKVAVIGAGITSYWARLAHVRIIAEIPPQEESNFWAADSPVKSQALKILKSTGAKVIISKIPNYASSMGWQRIYNTPYFYYANEEN